MLKIEGVLRYDRDRKFQRKTRNKIDIFDPPKTKMSDLLEERLRG